MTNNIVIERCVCLFTKYNFILILLLSTSVLAMLFMKMIVMFKSHKIFLTIFPFFLMPFLTCLGFGVGYQDKLQLFDRCFFIIDFAIIFALIVILTFGFMLIYNITYFVNKIKFCELIIIIVISLNILVVNSDKEKTLRDIDLNRVELITVAVDNSLNKYELYHKKYKENINILRSNTGKDKATLKFINDDDAPKYLMKFCDGKNLPFIPIPGEYLDFFYDIKEINVLGG